MTFLKDVSSRRSFIQMRVKNLREQLIRAEALVEKLKSGENETPDVSEDEAQRKLQMTEKSVTTLKTMIEKAVKEDIFADLSKPEGPVFVCNGCGKELPQDVAGQPPKRFKCFECDDYDLCESCHSSHPVVHPLFRLPVRHPVDTLADVVRPKTISGVLQQMFALYSQRPALGFRSISGSGSGIAKNFSWITYSELENLVRRVGGALDRDFALQPGDRVALCSFNCIEWFITDLACLMFGYVLVPILPSLKPEAIRHAVSQSGSSVVISAPESANLFKELAIKLILLNRLNTEPVELQKSSTEDYLWSSLLDSPLFDSKLPDLASRRDISSLATIIYTSGSTGTLPKGAMFTDKIWRTLCTANILNWGEPLVVFCKDPLCHISEREVCTCTLVNGGRIGMASRDSALIFEDIVLVSPCRLDSTPRFWNILYQQYKKARLLQEALLLSQRGPNVTLTESDHDSINAALREQFQHVLGKRCKAVTMGGAAVSADVKQLMKELFPTMAIREGYGTTEAGSLCDDQGRLLAGIEFKLLDVPALGYFYPRGELCVRTPVTIQGYYGNPTDTASAFDSDGYFHTGDVVELFDEKNKRFRIIDRVKNFFKLSQGEYISPEPLENVYLKSPWVDQIFICHADLSKFQEQTAVVAVVVPQKDKVLEWAQQTGSTAEDYVILCKENSNLKTHILHELQNHARSSNLRQLETVCGIVIDGEQWSAENGLLTSSHKLCRPALRVKYRDAVDAIYSSGSVVVAAPSQTERNDSRKNQLMSLLHEVLNLPQTEQTPQNLVGATMKTLGGDSLSAIRLSHVLKSKFHVAVGAESLVNMFIEQLQELLKQGGASSSSNAAATAAVLAEPSIDFEAEAKLNPDLVESIRNIHSIKSLEPRGSVFVTGGTGFVVGYIIAELTRRFEANATGPIRPQIYCLIRDDSAEAAKKRLQESLSQLRVIPDLISEEVLRRNVAVIPGDLSKPFFGLSQHEFEDLADRVDTIIHGGAVVNHVLPYESLKAANVGGTEHVIQLACTRRKKRIIYLSTISVFSWQGRFGETITERMIPTVDETKTLGGYGRSKWVAEHLLLQAHSLGLDVAIFRLGMVSWHQQLSIPNRQDWLYRLLLGIWVLGAAPAPRSATLNLIPVDIVSEAVCNCIGQAPHSTDAPQPPMLVNVVNRALTPISSLFESISRVVAAQDEGRQHAISQEPHWMQPLSKWNARIEETLSEARAKANSTVEKYLSPLLLFNSGLPDDRRERYEVNRLASLLGPDAVESLGKPLDPISCTTAWESIIADAAALLR